MRHSDKLSQVRREDKRDRGYRPGASNHKICPAIKEANFLAIHFAKIFVQPTCLRNLRDEFALCKRAKKCEDTCEKPDAEQEWNARKIVGHARRLCKNARANNGANHN